MPLARKKIAGREPAWYAQQRHENEQRNTRLFEEPGWYWCDAGSFYRRMFPEGWMQESGHANGDGRPNIIVTEDTGRDVTFIGDDGEEHVRRIMHRYTVTDDLDKLCEIRNESIAKNTFVFLPPVSYFGKSRKGSNARYLHAFMVDLDYVGIPQLENLLHQMNSGYLPQANYLVSSGTGLHVVYLLDKPFPLMYRYREGLQAIKFALTDLIWNRYTSQEGPEKRQHQGIFQPFRMVGTPTKLNGDIGNPKVQSYVCEAFSHDATPPATIEYLLSFLPSLKGMRQVDELATVRKISESAHRTVPLAKAKELWPEWYEERIEKKVPAGGGLLHPNAYSKCLRLIMEQASDGHRYWCVFALAVLANKCGIDREVLERDAYGLVERFDKLTKDPHNRFTRKDVAAALKAFEDGRATGASRHYTFSYITNRAGIRWEKTGVKANPPEKRLRLEDQLAVNRAARDARQAINGTNWWDNGNRDGAPEKKDLVRSFAYENRDMNHSQIARELGVSRPTVIKWLKPGWVEEYERDIRAGLSREEAEDEFKNQLDWLGYESAEEYERDYYAPHGEFEQEVVDYVVNHPWESYEQVAVYMGLATPMDVQRVIDDNRELYDALLMQSEEYLHFSADI